MNKDIHPSSFQKDNGKDQVVPIESQQNASVIFELDGFSAEEKKMYDVVIALLQEKGFSLEIESGEQRIVVRTTEADFKQKKVVSALFIGLVKALELNPQEDEKAVRLEEKTKKLLSEFRDDQDLYSAFEVYYRSRRNQLDQQTFIIAMKKGSYGEVIPLSKYPIIEALMCQEVLFDQTWDASHPIGAILEPHNISEMILRSDSKKAHTALIQLLTETDFAVRRGRIAGYFDSKFDLGIFLVRKVSEISNAYEQAKDETLRVLLKDDLKRLLEVYANKVLVKKTTEITKFDGPDTTDVSLADRKLLAQILLTSGVTAPDGDLSTKADFILIKILEALEDINSIEASLLTKEDLQLMAFFIVSHARQGSNLALIKRLASDVFENGDSGRRLWLLAEARASLADSKVDVDDIQYQRYRELKNEFLFQQIDALVEKQKKGETSEYESWLLNKFFGEIEFVDYHPAEFPSELTRLLDMAENEALFDNQVVSIVKKVGWMVETRDKEIKALGPAYIDRVFKIVFGSLEDFSPNNVRSYKILEAVKELLRMQPGMFGMLTKQQMDKMVSYGNALRKFDTEIEDDKTRNLGLIIKELLEIQTQFEKYVAAEQTKVDPVAYYRWFIPKLKQISTKIASDSGEFDFPNSGYEFVLRGLFTGVVGIAEKTAVFDLDNLDRSFDPVKNGYLGELLKGMYKAIFFDTKRTKPKDMSVLNGRDAFSHSKKFLEEAIRKLPQDLVEQIKTNYKKSSYYESDKLKDEFFAYIDSKRS